MPDQVEKLKAAVAELEAALHSLETVDSESRAVLSDVLREVQASLAEEGATESERQSTIDRLTQAARKFEGNHPTVAGVIERMIDVLGQMGI